MQVILSGIEYLNQHIKQLEEDPGSYRPSRCPNCGKAGLWCHGCYSRLPRHSPGNCSGQSVNIPRFICSDCNGHSAPWHTISDEFLLDTF